MSTARRRYMPSQADMMILGVSVERVRAGAHFPTDVLGGAMAGAGDGLLVPHLHREDTVKQRAVWVGYTPVHTQGGAATLPGIF